jgi:hypothetical protein
MLGLSPSLLRALRMESTSSMKITLGCATRATANRAFTSFSPSPIHLLVKLDAEMEKNVAEMLHAMARPMSVLPVPGGPKSSSPFGGARAPVNSAGFCIGQTTSSCTSAFACSCPALSHTLKSQLCLHRDTFTSAGA